MRRRAVAGAMLVLVGVLSAPRPAHAGDLDDRHWGVGFQLGWLGVPKGHLGAFIGGAANGYAITPELVARWQWSRMTAINAGFGIPHAGMGVSGWLGSEVFAHLLVNDTHTLALDVTFDPGLQLGYAGPDYEARRSDDFVGYSYAVAGPTAFAARLPTGIRLCWAGGYLDSYLEGAPIIAFTPSVEALFQIDFGTRVRF